ncbi:protein SGT1 homolog isoform X2 [Mobula birostris]|uniref:protein SGT1 homolog isoform X2 n=1 Tax=Mobula birostris TaxID=1983395 RepID=UPI003B27DF1B
MADERVFTDEFIAKCPEKALEELNAAVEQDLDVAEYYCQRAYANILLQSYKEVLKDASKALELKPNYALAYLRKGIAEYHLKMYHLSMESFTRGQELDAENANFNTWIKTCKENLDSMAQQDGNTEETPKHQTATRKIKHDWYQTDSHVIITIMIKNANKDDVKVEFAEKSEFCRCWKFKQHTSKLLVNVAGQAASVGRGAVDVSGRDPSSGLTEGRVSASVKLSSEEEYNLKLNLLHPIIAQCCAVKVLGTKIEIKMKKTEAIRWEKLEGIAPDVKHFMPEQPQPYPSSSHYTKDWDKLVMEIKKEENEEKPEGDAALNQLFQKIYADGSDEVKRAMNKSFTESGGTVLSTNWTEVGKKTVAVNPPDDMEWKKL